MHQERICYVCKQPFVKVHRFYDSLCDQCGEFNYAKRSQTADLSGQIALVTGARVKIGYQASLKLLRAGAEVIVTTRFPVDAADRYSRESDYGAFAGRLKIYGLDLRHTPSIEIFCRFLLERLPRLDHILNNACQTVRRPAGFFGHLLERETLAGEALPYAWRAPLADYAQLCRALRPAQASGLTVPAHAARVGQGLTESAALSQRQYLDEDFHEADSLFPAGLYDADRQQVDLRSINSWRLRLHEVETPELLEVHLVNAIAPYILNARLKSLLTRTAGRHKHIVNVSAMEGQFYRTTKTDKHPHTNMAKAALNMMTRTSAPELRGGWHPHERRGHPAGSPTRILWPTRRARPRKALRRRSTSLTARPASSIPSSPATSPARTGGAGSSRITSRRRGRPSRTTADQRATNARSMDVIAGLADVRGDLEAAGVKQCGQIRTASPDCRKS